MNEPIRLTCVLTHPVQYYAPWFRWIAASCPKIDLRVVYASAPNPRQQGAGFGREFTWDVPLTDGYASIVVRPAKLSDRFDSEHFLGLNVPEIAGAIRETHPDVVAVFGWYSITLLRAIRAARRLDVPVLYHGDTNLQSAPTGWRRPFWVAKTRRMLALSFPRDTWLMQTGGRAINAWCRVRRSDFRFFVHPPPAIVATARIRPWISALQVGGGSVWASNNELIWKLSPDGELNRVPFEALVD